MEISAALVPLVEAGLAIATILQTPIPGNRLAKKPKKTPRLSLRATEIGDFRDTAVSGNRHAHWAQLRSCAATQGDPPELVVADRGYRERQSRTRPWSSRSWG